MRNGFVLLSVLLVPGTLAAEVDKHQLRQTLRLPTIALQQGLEINTAVGPYMTGQQPDIKKEIAKIQKVVKGDSSDAERYARLGELLDELGDGNQSRMASKHAVALFRQRLKSDPDNALLLAQLGRCLSALGHHKEAQTHLRQAVQQKEAGWQCWTLLGDYLLERATQTLLAGMVSKREYLDGGNLGQSAQQGKIDGTCAHKTRELLKESLVCFDKAVELAPNQSDAFYRRGVCHYVTAWLHAAILAGQGATTKATLLNLAISPKAAHDFCRAAQLQPGDPSLVGTAACYQFVVSAAHGKPMAAKDRQCLLELVGQLKQLTDDPQPETAARASNYLGTLHVIAFHDAELGAKYYRQALKNDPNNDGAWDMATGLAAVWGSTDEALRLCQERLKHKQTAHNWYLLAKAHGDKGEWPQVETTLRAGLQCDAKDFYCTLGLAVALLRQEGNAKTRKEAFALLHKASGLVGQPPDADREQSVQIVEAAYNALYGETHVARKKLTRLSLLEPENDQVRQMLQAVGE